MCRGRCQGCTPKLSNVVNRAGEPYRPMDVDACATVHPAPQIVASIIAAPLRAAFLSPSWRAILDRSSKWSSRKPVVWREYRLLTARAVAHCAARGTNWPSALTILGATDITISSLPQPEHDSFCRRKYGMSASRSVLSVTCRVSAIPSESAKHSSQKPSGDRAVSRSSIFCATNIRPSESIVYAKHETRRTSNPGHHN